MYMQDSGFFQQSQSSLAETTMAGECMKTTFVSGVTTKLLVRGYADNFSLDDLWTVFTCYGVVSNIIIEQHGATVTYKDQSVFPELEFNVDMELVVGEHTMIFSKMSQALDTDMTDPTVYGAAEYSCGDQYPAPVFYPHHPPPLSPHYDTAILDVGQSQYHGHGQYGHQQYTVPPPPIPGQQMATNGNVFTFDHVGDANDASKRDHGCHVCSSTSTEPVKQLQPLTPITPTYPYPPPSFYLPPPAQTASNPSLMSLSGTSLLSTDSSSYVNVVPIGSDVGINKGTSGGEAIKQKTPVRATHYQYFTSPYKKFSKFKGVPTPAKFPLVLNNGGQGHQSSSTGDQGEPGDKKRWYQAGDRWGHRRQQSRSFSQVTIIKHCPPTVFTYYSLQSDIGETTSSVNKGKKTDKEAALEGISNLSLN